LPVDLEQGRLRCGNASFASGDFSGSSFTGIFIWREAIRFSFVRDMAARHGRGVDNMDIGTPIKDPNIDYATVARGAGAHGEGPITNPKDLAPALARAIAVVNTGEPAVVDVVTDPR
jgi:hypothetical protein